MQSYKISAKKPIKIDKVPSNNIDEQILRNIMISELDTINMYEQLCHTTENKDVKDIIEYIIKEEKEHFEKAEDLLEEIEGEEDDSD